MSEKTSTSARVADRAASAPTETMDLKQLLGALLAVREGDFSTRLPGHWTGIEGKIADAFNDVVTTNQRIAEELERVGSVVGKEGRTRYRARFEKRRGAWGDAASAAMRLEGSVTCTVSSPIATSAVVSIGAPVAASVVCHWPIALYASSTNPGGLMKV